MVTLLCGGNIDTTVLGRCLERGLAADGRLVKFSVTVSDRPGGIAELAKTLTQCGVSIKDMMHERAWIKSDIFAVTVSYRCSLLRSFESFNRDLGVGFSAISFAKHALVFISGTLACFFLNQA